MLGYAAAAAEHALDAPVLGFPLPAHSNGRSPFDTLARRYAPAMTLDAVFPPMPTPFAATARSTRRPSGATSSEWMRAGRRRRRRARLERRSAAARRGRIRSGDRARRARRCRATALLIAGTGRESTRGDDRRVAARRRARRRRGARAHAVVLQGADDAPMRFVRHYTAVADASPVPVLLYNYPGRDRRQPDARHRRPRWPRIPTSSA